MHTAFITAGVFAVLNAILLIGFRIPAEDRALAGGRLMARPIARPRSSSSGGGPVGLAAAIEARLAGLDVIVVEPRVGPIDKACGEGLMPGAVPALARLGVHPRGFPLRGVDYRDGRRNAAHRFVAGNGLGVRRTTLHAALRARAEELGARFAGGSRGVGRAGLDRRACRTLPAAFTPTGCSPPTDSTRRWRVSSAWRCPPRKRVAGTASGGTTPWSRGPT